VAEHSIHVASLVPPEFALEGLMHDAAEAYIGDVTRPLKALLPEYRAIEERIERAIAERFGLIWPWPEPVRLADTAMLALEKRVVMESIREDWAPLPPEPEPLPDIRHWPPHAADTVWFGRFRSYLRERERRAA
jgi:hypothetical protein